MTNQATAIKRAMNTMAPMVTPADAPEERLGPDCDRATGAEDGEDVLAGVMLSLGVCEGEEDGASDDEAVGVAAGSGDAAAVGVVDAVLTTDFATAALLVPADDFFVCSHGSATVARQRERASGVDSR